MKTFLTAFLILTLNFVFGQCVERKKDDGTITYASTNFINVNAVGVKHKDSLFFTITKKFDGISYEYSLMITSKSKKSRKFLDFGIVSSIGDGMVSINVGSGSEMTEGMLNEGVYYNTVYSKISELDLKRFLFMDKMIFVGLDDSFTIEKEFFSKFKDVYNTCIR